MKAGRRDLIKLAVGAGAALPWTTGLAGRWAAEATVPSLPPARLTQTFSQPPLDAKPGVYWYWLADNVTREGIVADLAAMHEAGIGMVALFSIGSLGLQRVIERPAASLTPYWWELIELAVSEAGRLGMQVLFSGCDGWATAGGPWITPELSMQKVVWTEAVVSHGVTAPVRLSQPEAVASYYRDLQVVAFPRPPEWDRTSVTVPPRVGGTLPVRSSARLLDPANDEAIVESEGAGTLIFSFAEPFLLRSVTIRTPKPKPEPGGPPPPQPVRAANSMTVEASDDGANWRRVGALEMPRHGWQTPLGVLTHSLPETRARQFRFSFVPTATPHFREDLQLAQLPQLALASIVLSGRPVIHHLPIKSAATWGHARRMTSADLPDTSCVAAAAIVDLTDRLRTDGTIDWRPPHAGAWTVLRIGCTSTGADNHPVTKNGHGLECDKLNPDAARIQFDAWYGKALDHVGPTLAGKVLHVFHVDSWEAKSQNWSPVFAAEFLRRRAYNVVAHLPIMAGIPVDSAEHCERVLFDVRRTIAECVTDNFYAPLKAKCEEHGCIFSGEVSNPTMPTDGLDYGRSVDMPMGEFWRRTPQNYKPSDIKEAVSAARVYGRGVAGAEAFTDFSITWDETPWSLKTLGDHHFAEGINRFFLHVYAHQPWVDRKPGMTLSGIGTFFGRTQTWWKAGKAWIDYLARSQALLQQGTAVADIAMFIGEDIPARAVLPEDLPVSLPHGYAYDSINRDALMRLARVDKGALVLPGGARYRVLLLPRGRRMTPQLAERLAALAADGLTIVGEQPEASPSASGGAGADARVAAAGRGIAMISYDAAGDLGAVLRACGTGPDVTLPANFQDRVEWTHRTGPGWNLYFLSNQTDESIGVTAAVRALGTPWLFDAADGSVQRLVASRSDGHRTEMAIPLDSRGSAFLLVVAGDVGDPVVAVEGESARLATIDNRDALLTAEAGSWTVVRRSGARHQVATRAAAPTVPVIGPWHLTLGDGAARRLAALTRWSDLEDEAARFFSGTGTYQTTVRLGAEARRPTLRWSLDLGEVRDLAAVTVNGRPLTTLWKPPFTIDVTDVLRAGENMIEIAVTNTWRNRLIGDADKPAVARSTFVLPTLHFGREWLPKANDPLLPAGLLGPVRLVARTVVAL